MSLGLELPPRLPWGLVPHLVGGPASWAVQVGPTWAGSSRCCSLSMGLDSKLQGM